MATGKEREQDHQYRMARLQALSSLCRPFLNFLAVAVICMCIYLSLRELAGKQTLADMKFKAVADLRANRWFAIVASWVLTTGTTGWALAERTLRKKHIARTSGEISTIQAQIDAGRKSSRLTKDGKTRPEDE